MANLIYSAIMSLDGYIEDERGKFDWAEPDDDGHAFVNAPLPQGRRLPPLRRASHRGNLRNVRTSGRR